MKKITNEPGRRGYHLPLSGKSDYSTLDACLCSCSVSLVTTSFGMARLTAGTGRDRHP